MAKIVALSRRDIAPIYKAYKNNEIKITKSDISKLYDYADKEGQVTYDPNADEFEIDLRNASRFIIKGDYKNGQKALDRALGIGTPLQTYYPHEEGEKVDKVPSKGKFGKVYIAQLSSTYNTKFPYKPYYVKFGPKKTLVYKFDEKTGTIELYWPYNAKDGSVRMSRQRVKVAERFLEDFKKAWRNKRYAPTMKKIPGIPEFRMTAHDMEAPTTTRVMNATLVVRPIKKSSRKSPPKKNAAKKPEVKKAVPKTAAKIAAKKQIGKTKITRVIKKTSRKTPKSGGKYTPIKLIKK